MIIGDSDLPIAQFARRSWLLGVLSFASSGPRCGWWSYSIAGGMAGLAELVRNPVRSPRESAIDVGRRRAQVTPLFRAERGVGADWVGRFRQREYPGGWRLSWRTQSILAHRSSEAPTGRRVPVRASYPFGLLAYQRLGFSPSRS